MNLNQTIQTIEDYSKRHLYDPFINNNVLKIGVSGLLLGLGTMVYSFKYINQFPQPSERLKNFYQTISKLDSLKEKADIELLLNNQNYRDSVLTVFQNIKSQKDSLENLIYFKEEREVFESKVNETKKNTKTGDLYITIGGVLALLSASPVASGWTKYEYRKEKQIRI